ncbi:LuxR C-terminal-related transcriptional regulator [Embleya sp. NPDC059237]|uniref:LuxR C-terminal-related transcriptional regulator n=1 Tax=Embleya sp. NPDC059237 TaxID=3346784 RepID=UPI0036943CFF
MDHVAGARAGSGVGLPPIAAKLRVPRPLGVHVPRPRIRALVEAAVARSLVVVVLGPGGTGKTSALAEWAEQREARPGGDAAVAWYSLDGRDNDPARFWAHAGAALARAAGCADPGHGAFPLGSDGWTAALADRIAEAGRDVALVLDEFEHIVNPQLAEQLDLLLRTAVGAVTVIPVTRARPPAVLERYRLSGRLDEVTWHELRFTPDEARDLLGAFSGTTPRAAEASALAEATDGWAGALALAGLRLGSGADPALLAAELTRGDRTVSDYLLDHMWSELDVELRDFLLDTAILDPVVPAVADAIRRFGRAGSPAPDSPPGSDAAEHLDRLRRDGLFVTPASPDPAGGFRYQRLFRQALLGRLAALGGARARGLHTAAAHWYAAHGAPETAIEHALGAADWPLVLDLVTEVYDELMAADCLFTLERWLSALPDDVVRGALRLGDRAMHLWCTLGRFDERDRWARVQGRAPGGRIRGLDQAWRLCLTRERGDLVASVREARAFVGRGAEQMTTIGAMARISLSRSLLLAGELASCRAEITGVLTAAESARPALPAHLRCVAHGLAGMAALLQADRKAAERHAHDAERLLLECASQPVARSRPECVILTALLEYPLDGPAFARLTAFLDDSPGVGNDHSMAAFAALTLAGAHVEHGEVRAAAARLAYADARLARCPNPLGLTDLRERVAGALANTADGSEAAVAATGHPVERLSERETLVLRYLRSELTLREIAVDLYISVNTVKTHARHVYRKLGVTGRADLTTRARN